MKKFSKLNVLKNKYLWKEEFKTILVMFQTEAKRVGKIGNDNPQRINELNRKFRTIKFSSEEGARRHVTLDVIYLVYGF